ncbi:serine hydrolase domain-containing protein [Amycolatopsis rhabdoformis]|uniref:Serine hydrolase domain-containing protein n=1 Tax=Amycolatopsis rhabdoformis TaxID=1448059 RepID=A0ABZ1I1F0_9PSEU|nr:serine hydrolase domain-containing protein [Amycolatopsis rhabdoformis]WSE27484.1 serine hydrolase domain-containing protein [Amycolatopsis rhabdoformis]
MTRNPLIRIAAAASAALLLTAVVTPAALAAPAAASHPAPTHSSLPPMNPASLAGAIAGLPNAEATGALVQVRGSAGAWSGVSGTADLSTGAPVPADAHFRIGSITKTFTAVVVLQLAAEHRLDLDAPVQRYLPGLLPANYPRITVAQLLNHTSGLPGVDLPEDPQWIVDNRYTEFTPKQVLATAFKHDLVFSPGTSQQYTNTNYLVAGLLIEKLTHHSYGSEVRDRILRPLGLRDTSVPGNDPNLPEPYAHGYQVVNGQLVDLTRMNQSIPWAAGEMISTTADLDKFLVALFQGRLVPKSVLGRMFTLPHVTTFGSDDPAIYSQGLMTSTVNGVTVWGKTGSRYGYTNGIWATRDLARRAIYSINTTDKSFTGQPEIVQKLALAIGGL